MGACVTSFSGAANVFGTYDHSADYDLFWLAVECHRREGLKSVTLQPNTLRRLTSGTGWVAVARDKDIDLEKKERQRKILDEQVWQKKRIEEEEKEENIKACFCIRSNENLLLSVQNQPEACIRWYSQEALHVMSMVEAATDAVLSHVHRASGETNSLCGNATNKYFLICTCRW